MKAWLRYGRRMRWLALVGLLAALVVAVSRGQAVPREVPEFAESIPATTPVFSSAEPPMVEGPMPMRSPASPSPPFTPPPPNPLPPEQAAPYIPGMSLPYPQPFGGGMEGVAGPPVPVVRLRLHAPARIEPEKEIEYRLTIENVSSVEAYHVLVRDRLPRGVNEYVRAEPTCEKKPSKDGLTDLVWEMGALKAGEQKTIVLVIKAKGSEELLNHAYVQFEHGLKVTTRIAKPSVQVRVTAPAQSILYQSMPFRIEVANTGDVALRNVVVTEELPAGLEFVEGKPEQSADKPLTWKLGDLQPNQTRRIDYQVISKQSGTFRDKAKVTADGGASASASAAVTVGEAKLKISISGPARRSVNRPIPFHITVRNLGTMPANNVQVSDELPGGVDFLSVDAGGRKEGGFVRWSLGTLAPGQLRSLVLVLRSPKPGWCWNEAEVRADNNLSAKERSNATRIDESAPTPALEIDKDTDTLVVGQKARYTIHLYNPGKDNVLKPSVLIAVPDELSIIGERGATTGQRNGQNVIFSPLDILLAGENKDYTIEVEAKKAGAVKLRARWTEGFQETASPQWWEDSTVIIDPTSPASGVASAPRGIPSGR
ncbi:MAG: hypothetical protein ACYC3I_25835 [Gemmataceae bacterium]